MIINSWRNEIINKFHNQNRQLILIHDEDYLLNDEFILNELTKLDYEIIRFEDSVSFRYFYEQQYRNRTDNWKLVVYTNEPVVFPFEYMQLGFNVTINLRSVFPKFSAALLKDINQADLDTLYTIHSQYNGSSSDRDSLKYIVKHLYKIPYDIIDNKIELYKMLLSIHYEQNIVPHQVKQYLFEVLEKKSVFYELPVRKLIMSSEYFYKFVENEWELLLKSTTASSESQLKDFTHNYETHPFADHHVRRLMDNLFLEGKLSKIKTANNNLPEWMHVGIQNETVDLEEKCKHLEQQLKDKLSECNGYKDWIEIIDLISDYKLVLLDIVDDSEVDYFQAWLKKINIDFQNWVQDQFYTLTSLPPLPLPKMVHHIPEVIKKDRMSNEKVALLVLDGMNFIQWKQIRRYLQTYDFSFEETGVFAWVPTITPVSRQAIFSGNMPYVFADTIKTTNAEEKQWKKFWENQGVLKQYTAYQRSLGAETYDRTHIKAFKNSSLKIYGAVVDVIDRLMHSTVLGEKEFISNLNIWLESNYLVDLLNDLNDDGYTVYITSDHGNTSANGIGRFPEGVLVDQRGQRARIYNDQTIYEDSAKKMASILWNNIGLPENYLVLSAKYGEAFVNKGNPVITHGGISIEEMIVPFIKVQKK